MKNIKQLSDKKKTVLLIEDSKNLAKFLSDLLIINNYNVIYFTDVFEAMDYLKNIKDNIDIVLLDYYVGEVTGYHIALDIKRIMPHVCIILMTAYSNKARVKELIGSKTIDGLLNKPFKFQEFIDIIKNCKCID